MKENNKILSSFSTSVLFLVIIGATYAFFAIQTETGATTDIIVNASTVDVFTFEVGSPLSLTIDQFSFSKDQGSKTSSTFAKAMLTANNKTNNATEHYYLYLNIKSNSFVYSYDSTKPEILLKITDKNNNEVKPTIDGVEYKTVTDAMGESISGYDITTIRNVLPIYENKEITTTSTALEQWNVFIIFVNYDFNQAANAGKSFKANLLIQKSELRYDFGDINADGIVDANDLEIVNNYINGNNGLNKYEFLAADVNEDNIIDELDNDIILANINGLINLPYNNSDKYEITYNLNDGNVVERLRTIYTSDFDSSLFGKVKKTGYGFVGWTGSNGDTPENDVTISKGTTGDLNYVANWAPYADATQDGKINIMDLNICWKNPSNLTKTEFVSCDVNLDGEVDVVDRDIIWSSKIFNKKFANVMNILPYIKQTYTITYDLNGGTLSSNARYKYVEETARFTLEEPEFVGYEFIGWTGSNGNVPQTSVTIESGTTGNLHFVANWEKIQVNK